MVNSAEAYFEVPQPGELSIFDDRQDKLVGLRMVTFVSRTVQLGGHKVLGVEDWVFLYTGIGCFV